MITVNDKEFLKNVINKEIYTLGNELMDDAIQSDYILEMNNLYDEKEDEYKEIFQYFIISDWLYEKLNQEKEPTIIYKGLNIWGRCGCGYSLEDESCLINIVNKIVK